MYLISEETFKAKAAFGQLFFDPIEFFLVASKFFKLGLKRGDDTVFLVERGS